MPAIIKPRKQTKPLPTGRVMPKKKDGRSLHARHDWDAIRTRYFESDKVLRYKDLALEFGVPQSVIAGRASKERWGYLRAEEQRKLFKKRLETRTRKLYDAGVEFDDLAANTAKIGLALVTGRLAQISEVFNASSPSHQMVLEKLRNGHPVSREDLYTVINYKELDVLARAGMMFQDMGRKALGTDVVNLNVTGEIEQHVSGGLEHQINVKDELAKDDPERLAAMLEAFERAGILKVDTNVVEGEVVEPTKAIDMAPFNPESNGHSNGNGHNGHSNGAGQPKN